MQCTRCGFQCDEGLRFCPNCGLPLPRPLNQGCTQILQAVSSTLFLLICIFISATVVFSISMGSMPLIQILLAVFLWLAYAQAKKGNPDPGQLRCVSGTLYAEYIITFVGAGCVALCGILVSFLFSALTSDPTILTYSLQQAGLDQATIQTVEYYLGLITAVPTALIMIGFLVAAVLMVVINIFSLGTIHKFAKSVYQSLETGNVQLKKVKAAKVWLFILGGLNALSAVSILATSVSSFLIYGCSAAAAILAGVLVGQVDVPQQPAAPEGNEL